LLPTDNFSLRHLRVQPVGVPIIRQDRHDLIDRRGDIERYLYLVGAALFCDV
jgi:hypothetical protein